MNNLPKLIFTVALLLSSDPVEAEKRGHRRPPVKPKSESITEQTVQEGRVLRESTTGQPALLGIRNVAAAENPESVSDEQETATVAKTKTEIQQATAPIISGSIQEDSIASRVEVAEPPLTEFDDYIISIGDSVRFAIEEDPSQGTRRSGAVSDNVYSLTAVGTFEFRVSAGYEKSITIKALGKTLATVRNEIEEALERAFYHVATVDLRLINKEERGGVARFFGAVKGAIPIESGRPKLLSDAILELGYDDFANLRRVRVIRRKPQPNESKEVTVNVQRILDENTIEDDVILRDGDRVEVPERNFVF